jgi:N-acetylmuramoyl-L-alanine amidase
MKVYVDIGHGERGDPGAVSGRFIEHQMNIKVAHAFADHMKQHGWEVKIEQGNLEMGDSARVANNWGADLLLSFHFNAGGGDRGEVIYSWESGALELANAVAEGIKRAGQTEVRVYKSKANSSGTAEYFGILRVSKMPAVIVEPCFIDNPVDRQIADTDEELKHIGYCIADALAEYYGGDEMIYKTLNDVPDWGKPLVKKLIDRKSLAGDGKGNINLPESTLKTLVILEREGVLKK